MRRKLILTLIALTITTFTSSAHAETQGALECVQQKLTALKNVNSGNVGSMLRQHFSVNALAASAYGGGAKWKAHPEDHAKILGHFSEGAPLKRLVDGLEAYRNAKLMTATAMGRKVAVTMKSDGKSMHSTVVFAADSCTIVYMCVNGIGCIHELFK